MKEHQVAVRDDPARYFEALGRVLTALRDSHALNGAHSIDWRPDEGGRSWHIEWQEGPFPAEAARAVKRTLSRSDSHAGWALRGVVELGRFAGSLHHAHLRVLGVPVTLRALNPVGAAVVIHRFRREWRQSRIESR